MTRISTPANANSAFAGDPGFGAVCRHTRGLVWAGGCGLLLVLCSPFARAQITVEDAWPILRNGVAEHNTQKRAAAVSALGLLQNNPRAAEMAEQALSDPKPEVRKSAATALGQMRAKQAIASLRGKLDDPDTAVALSAAASLKLMGDNSAYQLYYELLVGERKSGEGVLAQQQKRLHDPKQLAQLGVAEGLGFVPFGGVGYQTLKTLLKDNKSAVRAAAAKALARDPDPRSAEALKRAVNDKKLVVRMAALDAIAERDDPALLPAAVDAMTDDKYTVRYLGAAVAIRLSAQKHQHAARK